MSAEKPTTVVLPAGLTIRESDAPFGNSWGMPAVALLAVACVCLALLLPAGPVRRLVAPATCTLVLVAAVTQTVRHRRWDREVQRRRFMALESMIDMTEPMGTEEGAEEMTLSRLPNAVSTLLGMKASCIGLLEDDGQTFHIVASSGINPTLRGRKFPLTQLPTTKTCVESKYVACTDDVLHPDRPVNSTLAIELHWRSMVHIPMVYKGRVLGVMVLGHDHPRALTELDTRRAWLWGCLGGVLLSHGRIYNDMSRTLQQQQILMEHRNALYNLNTAIHRMRDLESILQYIVEAGLSVLEVDLALIWMVAEDDPESLILAAATAPYSTTVRGFRLPVSGSKAGLALSTRTAIVVEDGAADPGLSSHLRTVLPHGSLIFEPLMRGDGQPLGLLVLIRHKAGAFRPDQLELARLFSQRASAVLEMAHLHQQARNDADAKATLLRELNHRVKNNLAAIISLLSINQPNLSREARRWLDRVIDRIGAMAQAHDLFNVGPRRVTLDELVQRTIRSLSVVKPAGVAVKTELNAANARLRTERAVTLAMAIHELCFNGIVHGLGEHGTLTIRARRDNGQLAVEIVDDDGTGQPATLPIEPDPVAKAADAAKSDEYKGGIGLNLVRGLVGRELHGRFDLAPAPGGAVATVQFPLLADETGSSTVSSHAGEEGVPAR